MSERITETTRIEREAAADRLEALAGALRAEGSTQVEVGNKTIELHPPERVNYGIEVVEKQRRFRGNRESVRIELDWKPE